jgi:ribosomal protein S18 acetylase RimI-like enzyme
MNINYKIIDQNTKDLSSLDKVCKLMDKINEANQAPHLYPPDRQFFIKTLSEGNLTILAFDEDKLVGYLVVKFLKKWPSYFNKTPDINPEETTMFLFMIVDQDYRGKNISSTMNNLALKQIKISGKRFAISTAHPENTGSIKSLEKLGMSELYQDEIFEEKLLRSIMFMEIS